MTDWISCKDRLPCHHYPVLTYAINGHNKVDHITEDRIGTDGNWTLSLPGDGWVITHWMPLPEPPKGVNTDAAD